MVCDPFACGTELTVADFYAHYCLGPAAGMARVAGVDLLSESPRLGELLSRMAVHPSIERVTQEAAKK
jgi:glutathione S-transferase